MKILKLIEDFSHHRENRNIEKSFQCLVEYKNFAMKFKNYSSFENFDIEPVKSKKISFLWNQVKFEKALQEYNFEELEESFDEMYHYSLNDPRSVSEDFWDNISNLLKPHNSKIYEINSLKLEVEVLKEVITSYNYSLPIPLTRKVQKIIELVLIASKNPKVLRTLNKYFHLLSEPKLEQSYHAAFPDAKSKNHVDNFYHNLKKSKVDRDIRVDVLVDSIEIPISKELEKKTRYITQATQEKLFSYLVPSRTLTNINIVEFYISEAQYDEALKELQKFYEKKEKDTNFYYLKAYITYRTQGAIAALRSIQDDDVDSLVVSDKEFLSLVARLRAEILVRGAESEN